MQCPEELPDVSRSGSQGFGSAGKNYLAFQGQGYKDLGGDWLSEGMVLLDAKGGKIHTTVRKQLLYLFQRKLEERLVYVLFVVDAKDLILILCFISRGLLRQLGEYRVP
ncbi:uncharacterized protein LOC123898107 isoform X6 [Trifolium pratense]|uniref:uncharacterized protein LOC123898107 isoform X6 n=1 Tax=Trifolium pratense TaxID=57577 RepID=UPI001E697394|nr:uncharacterized protein LOC123898107 isoform X6 [Trifolium pratense]XP_045804936.1 uncharacterized protein LOC123898107 isoform X6 [Trifolium pratense]